MVITYHGAECIKVSVGDTVVVFNPISKSSALKPARFGADIALVSLNHPDMNGIERVTQNGKEPFTITGPGEYEVSKVFVRGLPEKSTYGGEERVNTVYLVTMEDVTLCFMGAINSRELSQETKEAIDDVHVLFVPIGGDGVLGPHEAHQLGVDLEPNVVIPMHYGDIGEQQSLEQYLKEEGVDSRERLEKYTFKRRDIESKEGEVVLLDS
jgi:L-ascorbate metabolism protein UlaG (beta-lactamase superfamily)